MTKDEALKLGLEALEGFIPYLPLKDEAQCNRYDKAITALKKVLAQPEQEPVAWGVFEGNLHDMFFSPSEAQEMADLKGTHAEVRPLYTTPPQRKPLTDEEMKKIWYAMQNSMGWYSFQEIARAIEAAHGIKE